MAWTAATVPAEWAITPASEPKRSPTLRSAPAMATSDELRPGESP